VSTGEIVALASALAAALGAYLEILRGRRTHEIQDLRERLRAVEVRCERLEADK
jgi:hypothetical protein